MGSKGRQQATQTVVQELPSYARPYFERLLGRSEALSLEPYRPYPGSRLAPSEDYGDIAAGQDIGRAVAGSGIPGLGAAQAGVQDALTAAQAAGDYTAGTFNPYNFTAAERFTDADLDSYMSPYIQGVIERQKSGAVRDFERMAGARGAEAVRAGAFGGSRQGVQNALAEEALGRQLADIEATGLQSAYDRAAQQFAADRAARMQIEGMSAAELGRTQQIGEASRQFAASQGLAGLDTQLRASGQLAGLGEMERASQIQNAQILEAIGRSQQAETQMGLDMGYQDFLRQTQWPWQQASYMNAVLQGLPIANTGTQTTYMPYNPMQELLGAGLAGLSLYRAFQ